MSVKPKIILCEDELIISLDLKRILKRCGYNVAAVFKSAEDVLKYLETDRVELVIADVNLKGAMNGIDLAEILVKKQGIKVIFLTGSPMNNHDAKIKELDCDYLMKPFDETTLREKLSKAFAASQTK